MVNVIFFLELFRIICYNNGLDNSFHGLPEKIQTISSSLKSFPVEMFTRPAFISILSVLVHMPHSSQALCTLIQSIQQKTANLIVLKWKEHHMNPDRTSPRNKKKREEKNTFKHFNCDFPSEKGKSGKPFNLYLLKPSAATTAAQKKT